MTTSLLTIDQRMLRASDSNSLLRLYDMAKGVLCKSPSLQERDRALRASERIAKELSERKVKF